MSASITRIAARNQLAAMGCACFDIGVLQQSGRMLLRESWSTAQIEAAIKWLGRENACGAQIFVRPHGEHALSLLDDLTFYAILALKRSGFDPAVIVETSRRNFQAWLNHGRLLNRALSTHAAKALVRRFGGDPSSADWRHFGRLAGFTNQKPTRRLDNGFAPFVKLHECSGRAYSKADEFIDQVSAVLAEAAAEREARWLTTRSVNAGSIRPIGDFHTDPRYGGDLHRADMAWAFHAASRGLSQEEIRTEIFHARDLSKKGPTPTAVSIYGSNCRKGGHLSPSHSPVAQLRYGRRGRQMPREAV
jgi:DNA primase RepB-like protein